MTDTGSIVDFGRTACLCDVGQPDYWAAVCVTPSGEDVLWLACKDELDAVHPRCGRADQRHEQLGPLPLDVVRKITIGTRAHRCGRPTQAGTPCRIRVTHAGIPCVWHRQGATG